MDFTEEQLSVNAKMPVKLVDRSELPFEEKFAESAQPEFSEKEQFVRRKAIHQQVESEADGPALRKTILKPMSWFYVTVGEGFSPRAVIFPSSPFLKEKDFWEYYTGLPISTPPPKTIDPISTLHESFHPSFWVSPDTKQNSREILWYSEMVPDVQALATYLELGGHESDVEDFICMRRISAFIGHTPLKYWTAAACEAALRGEIRFPKLADALGPTRELQIRVYENLKGVDRMSLDEKTYRKECQDVVRYKENDTVKRESVWTAPNFGLALTNFSPFQVVKSLAFVVDEANLSEATCVEAEKTLDAFSNFCPSEARRLLHSNPSEGLDFK